MKKRKSMFEIEVPDEVPADLETKSIARISGKPRRGPMATAMRENADAVRERAEAEAEARAENDRLAHEHVRLKRLGLVVDLIPLDAIDTTKLRRDRAPDTEELDELIASIRDVGLSNPIRVERAGDRYELIQGWRRLQAYRALSAEDPGWSTIPAGIVAEGDTIETSYRRMVDENLVRKDISFAEMAALAQGYAADPEIACNDVGEAVAQLFASAGYQKRSYIRAFAELLVALDKYLIHPEAIPRNLGLAVRKQISEGNPGLSDLVQALSRRPDRDEAMELSILRGFAGGHDLEAAPAPQSKPSQPSAGVRKAKTSFRIAGQGGEMRCSAADGKLEIRGGVDFSSVDRKRLEAAVQAFLDAIEG